MNLLYFPQNVYEEAHLAFLTETGIDPEDAYKYCTSHLDFFVEVAFSYVEKTPWPLMETT